MNVDMNVDMNIDMNIDLDKSTGLPSRDLLSSLVGNGVDNHSAIDLGPYIDKALLAAASDLASRPSKKFRAHLVHLGYQLCRTSTPENHETANPDQLRIAAQAIELMHAGSLIIDDIQDGSTSRRGAETIHRRFGIPGALCTGNWLYFWPQRLLRQIQLPLALEHHVISTYLDALENAHYGQALDLGLRADEVPKAELDGLARTITDLKTGSITSLAMEIGALLARDNDKDRTIVATVARFGRKFGAALQHLDDLGNVLGRDAPEKRYEDLLQGKITAVWGFAATATSNDDFTRLQAAVQALRDGLTEPLNLWLQDTNFLARASAAISAELEHAFTELTNNLQLPSDNRAVIELRQLAESLTHAYI